MIREIKFKAWHKKEKLMCDVQVLSSNGAFLIGVKKGKDEILDRSIILAPKEGRFCPNEDIDLLQFAGLKDNEGKGVDVYEGDIVKWADNVYKVYFFKGTFYAVNLDHEGEGHPNSSGWLNEGCEVIGNIYENPELLK